MYYIILGSYHNTVLVRCQQSLILLQSKQVKRSSHEWINNNYLYTHSLMFVIANLMSGIISIIWLLDEWCKIQIKPECKTQILIGLLLTSGVRVAWEFDGCTNLHNQPRLLTLNKRDLPHFSDQSLEFENINCLMFEDTGKITER